MKKFIYLLLVISIFSFYAINSIDQSKLKAYPIDEIRTSGSTRFEFKEDANNLFLLLSGGTHLQLKHYLTEFPIDIEEKNTTKSQDDWDYRIIFDPKENFSDYGEAELLIFKNGLFINGYYYEAVELEAYENFYELIGYYYNDYKSNYENIIIEVERE